MMNHKKKNTQVEIPPISEPLRDPKYVAPIANGLPHSGPFWTTPPDYRVPGERFGTDASNVLADPLGSWTGRPLIHTDMPVQDADDL